VAVAGRRDAEIDRRRIGELTEHERSRFLRDRPRSASLLERGSSSMARGVPMAWMTQLFGHPPVFMDRGGRALAHHPVDVNDMRALTSRCTWRSSALIGELTA
jgi:hypothetical protein